MEEPSRTLLKTLIELSKVDSSLSQIRNERKKNDNDLKARKLQVKATLDGKGSRAKVLEEKRERYRKEEKAIKEENEKLIARRKALTSFSNYKLQQAAEKEIENSARQLSQRDEMLLGALDEMEALEADLKKAETIYEDQQKGYDTFVVEVTELFTSLEDRESRHHARRAELLPSIPKKEYTLYERIHEKYPDSAVAAVKQGACSGCFMQVGPQVMVQISRGDSLTRCPGCGRIVFLEESKEE